MVLKVNFLFICLLGFCVVGFFYFLFCVGWFLIINSLVSFSLLSLKYHTFSSLWRRLNSCGYHLLLLLLINLHVSAVSGSSATVPVVPDVSQPIDTGGHAAPQQLQAAAAASSPQTQQTAVAAALAAPPPPPPTPKSSRRAPLIDPR